MTQWDIEIRSSRYSTVAYICLNHIGERLALLASEDRQESPLVVFVPSSGVAEALPLISSLIDGSLPHRSAHIYTLVYFHSLLSLFQFLMAGGAHPHPRCVFFGKLE